MREQAESPLSRPAGTTNLVGEETCKFGFLITIDVGRTVATTKLRWVEGHDESLFESFSGFLKDRVGGVEK